MFAGTDRAWAANSVSRLEELDTKTYTVSYKGKAHDAGYRDYLSTSAITKKPTQVKSSNPGVATASVVKKDGVGPNGKAIYYLRVTLKKAGTTKLTFRHNGTNYALNYVVTAYANPLASLKIGSKDYASYLNLGKLGKLCDIGSSSSVPVKGFTGKLVAKPKAGWAVTRIEVQSGGTQTEVANGGKVSGAPVLTFYFKHKATGQFEGIGLVASKAPSLKAARVAL